MNRLLRISLLAATALLSVALPASAADTGYRVLSTIKTDGQGAVAGFRVDPASRRLYVARDGAVEVIDIDAGKKVGQIALKGTPSGLALAPDLNRGFVSNAADNSVTIFDLASLQTVGTAKAAGGPRDMEYDPLTKKLFVSGAEGGQLTVVSAATGKAAGSVALGGSLRQAVADNRGNLFVADAARNVLHVVSTGDLKEQGTIPVWPGEKPTGLALDDKERRIYVAAGNDRMIIVDPDPGQMIGQVETKGKGEAGVAMQFAPARLTRMFIPTADGTVSVIQNAKLTATLEATVAAGAKGTAVAFDPKSGKAFVAGADSILVIGK